MQVGKGLGETSSCSRTAIDEGSFSREMAATLRLESARTFVSRSKGGAETAITHVRRQLVSEDPVGHETNEDALLVSVSFLDGYLREFWLDGQPVPRSPPQPAGIITLIDRRRSVSTRFKTAVHGLQFYFPLKALHDIASESNLARFEDVRLAPCTPVPDPTMHYLGSSLLPAFEKPEQASRLFIEHVALAAAGHMLLTYAGLHERGPRGGLAPWQLKRAEEMLSANLGGDLPLASIAAECRLSTSHFTRAFRQTTGLPPHQWLLKRRVETAKAILRDTSLSLGEIARTCGFADQSHFTRVFSRLEGQGPGAWRRAVQA
jgi:AraC-like DNA-binding protein